MAKVTIANLNTLLDTVVTSNIAVQTAQSAVTNATVQADNAATSAQAAALSKSQIDQQVIVAEGLADDVNANMLATDAIKDVILALEVAIGLKADQVTLDKATVAAMLGEVLTTKSGVDVKAGLIEELVEDFHTKYLGALLVAPTVSWGGMELATGMIYYDITKNSLMIYVNANIWVPIIEAANVLIATNNLSDIPDKEVARTNLGVLSAAEVEANIQADITAIKGKVNGLAELDAAGLVPAAQLPSYVDDVIEVATYADLPVIGEGGKIYIVVADETSNGDTRSYRWTGTVYAMVSNTLTAVDVKSLYESNLDTNAFTDAEQLKLSGIESGATVNSTDAVLLARENHTGTQSLTTITPDNVIGTPTDIDDMTKLFNHTNSSGVMHGCELTVNGDGSVNISAGYAMLRATADAHATLYKIEVAAQANLVLLEGVNYISLNWNGGSPIFTTSASETSFNCLDVCIAYVAVRDGTTVSYTNATRQNVDSNRKTRRLFLQFDRFIHLGNGSKLGNAGALAVSVTAGKFNFMLEELSHTAFDTSVAGTATANVFNMYYRNGIGGWVKTIDQKVVNTTTYDNGTGTLATLGNNKFGVTWFYMILNNPNHLVAIKGQAEYADSASADAATPPAAVPAIIEGLGVLLGFVTYQKNATEISKVFSAFTQIFNSSQAVTHNSLSGLQGGAVNDYQHMTSAQVGYLTRADKYLAAQNIANMVYTGDDLTKIQYNTATDIDYEVLTYGVDGLSNIAHYVGGALAGNTVLTYAAGDLVSAVFTGV